MRAVVDRRDREVDVLSLPDPVHPRPRPGPRAADTRADVVVVGTGLLGLCIAHALTRAGRRVLLLDAGAPCGFPAGAAALPGLAALARRAGDEAARTLAAAQEAALDAAEALVRQERLGCGFERVDAWRVLAPGEDPLPLLAELEAQRRAGVLDAELVERAGGLALRLPGQARLDEGRLAAALAAALSARGARWAPSVGALRVEGGARVRVVTGDGGTLIADDVVLAPPTPAVDVFALHGAMAAWRWCAVALQAPRGTVAPLWTVSTPAGPVTVQLQRTMEGRGAGHDQWIVNGGDRRAGDPLDAAACYAALAAAARALVPCGEVLGRWSARALRPVDGLPLIGPHPAGHEHVYVATPGSGPEWQTGFLAGSLLTHCIVDGGHPWAALFDPRRATATTHDPLIDEPAPDVPPGTGALVREGLSVVAVRRGDDERLVRCTAAGLAADDGDDGDDPWCCPTHRLSARGGSIGPAPSRHRTRPPMPSRSGGTSA